MAVPLLAGTFARGLLGGAARTAATGAAQGAAKGVAKEGMKSFAKNMVGKTSDDYKSRVEGVNPDTGEYLTPEERKARFKGFATGSTETKKPPIPLPPSETIAKALPPAGGVANAAKSAKSKDGLVKHLEKIQGYLEKLLVLEKNATDRLHERILGTAREAEQNAAAAEEDKQERGKNKKEKQNPIVKGMKKKASGIFQFLMDLAMQFIGFKILDWFSNPENKDKVTKLVEFVQGTIDFISGVANAIGGGISWTVEKLGEGVEYITNLIQDIGEFFSFQWVDLSGIKKQFDQFISFFTESIPNAIKEIEKFFLSIPDMIFGLSDAIVDGVLGMFGVLGRKKLDDPEPEIDVRPEGSKDTPPSTSNNRRNNRRNKPKYEEGGAIKGPSHANGGVDINAEGDEYILNKVARQNVERILPGFLDYLNFKLFPRKGPVKVARRGRSASDMDEPESPYMGYGGTVKYFSVNDGRQNKILQAGKQYSYKDLLQHHGAPAGVGKGAKRQDGWPKDYTLLKGTNLASSPNADIPVPVNSKVIKKGPISGYGNTVIVKAGSLGNMLFAHLSKFGKIKEGDELRAGTIVGTQGNTPGGMADHLHLDAEAKGHEAFINYITTGKPTHGSVDPTGQSPSSPDSTSPEESTDTTSEESTTSDSLSISDALKSMADMMTPKKSGLSGNKLNLTQEQNKQLQSAFKPGVADNVTSFAFNSPPIVSTSADMQSYTDDALGDNFPPFKEAFFNIQL